MGLAEDMRAQGMPPELARMFGAIFGGSEPSPEERADDNMRELETFITGHRDTYRDSATRAERLAFLSKTWTESIVGNLTNGTSGLRTIGNTMGSMEVRITELEDFIKASGLEVPFTPQPEVKEEEGSEDGRYFCPIHQRYE